MRLELAGNHLPGCISLTPFADLELADNLIAVRGFLGTAPVRSTRSFIQLVLGNVQH